MKNRSITQLAALALGVGLLLGAVYLGLGAGPAAADSPPVASRTPGSIDFGSQQAGTTSAPRTITVTAVSDGWEQVCDPMLKPPCETSDDPTSISNPTIGGTNAGAFKVSSQSCTGKYLWQGESCSIDVTFSPAAAGSYSATLNINSDSSWSTGNQVQLSGNAPPTNDNFANSQVISSSAASVSGTTQLATRESGEPDHYTSNPDAGDWVGDHTVWYQWTAPSSGPTTIDTCTSTIDSILAVYTGSSLQNLSRVGDNNNSSDCPTQSQWEWGSKVTFNASAGTTYRIVVGDAGGARQSTFTLKLPTSAASTTYTIEDLGAPPGHISSHARDVNDSGQVVGYSDTPSGDQHAFLYSDGQMKDLGPLGPSGGAYSINDSGQVVGRSEISGTSSYRPFLYSDGQMQDLGTLPGYVSSEADDVNNSGQVVGLSSNTFADTRAFLYSGGQMQNLGTLGSYRSAATGINDSGVVVGYSDTPSGDRHAFLYSGGQMQDLGTLPGSNFSEASDINGAGQIVGTSSNTFAERRAFLYSGGQMQDLGTLPGGNQSRANDVNDSGQVVGESWISGFHYYQPFLYSGGQMKDLSTLIPAGSGWRLLDAVAINTTGQIVGTGVLNGQVRAFLATPATSTPPDTPPSVTSTAPIPNATGVAPSANVTATFSEQMQPATVKSAFKLFKQGSTTKLSALVTYDAGTKKATLNPSVNLKLGTTYKAVVSTGAKDVADNPLDQDPATTGSQPKQWVFTVRR